MSERSFDPEVVVLLDEIARDPRSSLLRIPEKPLLRWAGRTEEVISPHGSYLTKAERHLVTAYREEAAWVLREACVGKLISLPALITLEYGSCASRETLEAKAAQLASCKGLPVEAQRTLARMEGAAPVLLASAALRLTPSDFIRNDLALSFHVNGEYRAAMRLLRFLAASRSDAVVRSYAWENCGLVQCRRGQLVQAMECYHRSRAALPDRWHPILWSMLVAIQVGDAESALTDARELEVRVIPEAHIDEQARMLIATRAAGVWKPLPGSRRVLSGSLKDRFIGSARRIIDAFSTSAA